MKGQGGSLFKLEFFVGLFFLGAIVLFIYLMVVVNGKEFLFSKDGHIMEVLFPSIETLNKNDKVYCMGVNVGRVKDFNFSDGSEGIMVKFNLDKEIILKDGYAIEIRNTSLLGGKHVDIYPGNSTAQVLPPGTIIRGKAPADIMQEASQLVSRLKEDEESFRKEFLSGEFSDNLKSASKNLNDILASINGGEGVFAKMLKDPSLYDDAKKTMAQVDKAAEELKAILADTRGGKGSIGKLFTDEKAYEDLKAAIEDIRKFAADLGDAKGSLGKISSDDGKLYNQLSEMMSSMNKVALNLSEGKGTIGKMLNDDALYYETKTAINQLKGAVEDFREQAPIATLGSMLLGAL